MAFMKHCQSFFHPKKTVDFTSLLQAANQEDLTQIYTHPFNDELFSGTLPAEIFGRYLRDDFYYLQRFAFGLNRLAGKITASYPKLAGQISSLAQDIVANEQNMQRQYHEHLHDMEQHQPGRVITEYADYLTESLSDDDMLLELIKYYPCFYIYAELGRALADLGSLEQNPYKEWIITYTGSDFVTATDEFTKTINQAAEQAPALLRAKMSDGFKRSVQYEFNFIHSVYHHKVAIIALSYSLASRGIL